jgi:hypothetical protein
MKVAANVRTLSEALIQIEELLEKMGGRIEPEMEVRQMANPGCIWIKPTLVFDQEKLNGYTAQSPLQKEGGGKELSMDGVSETFKL